MTALLLAFALTAPAEEGFTPLFNGTDLSGWRTNDDAVVPENWKVAEGMIRLSGGSKPNLATRADFDDFELRLEWRANKPSYNSGVYIRSGRNVGANQLNLAKGSEGQLVGSKIAGQKKVPELQNKAGEWNEWRVIVEGTKLTFFCNGKPAWETNEFTTPRGHIGFQAEGAPIDFRNIRIREIGVTPVSGAFTIKPNQPVKISAPDGKKPTVWRLEYRTLGATVATLDAEGFKIPLGENIDAKAKKAVAPAEEWNTLDVRENNVRVNGEPMAIRGELKATMLTLTAEKGTVEARNVRVR